MKRPATPNSRSVTRLASLRHAARGVWQLLATQMNARIHACAAVTVVAMGYWLEVSLLEWGLLILAIGLVLCAEGLNTALEFVVDLASPQWHELARDAKDVAAGAVLLASVTAFGVGLTIFLPKFLQKL
ncbi:undecaprenol kinase [mine drainage metagenome]|uniref:Undecaprenol kinase n=1 Tax=mine drainage metagenome TaxID=410659 RepID=A0A1J5Q8E8_9ZZZZ